MAKEPTPVRSNSPAPSGGGDGVVGYDGIKVALKDLRISSAEADDDFIVKTYRKPKSTEVILILKKVKLRFSLDQ